MEIKRTFDIAAEIIKATNRNETAQPPARFHLPFSVEQVFNLLGAYYKAEVLKRIKAENYVALSDVMKANIKDVATWLCDPNKRPGLLLFGNVGTGKTTLLYALQSALNQLNQMGHFTFLSEYFQVGMEIVDAKDVVIMAKDLKAIGNLRSRSMLAIDDLGKEAAEVLDFGNALSPVIDLLEYRYQHQLFTAITTNLTNEEIAKKYGKRIADRFNEMLEVIIFQDITYRH